MPATDYWFRAYIQGEDGDVDEIRDHFSLIRRKN